MRYSTLSTPVGELTADRRCRRRSTGLDLPNRHRDAHGLGARRRAAGHRARRSSTSTSPASGPVRPPARRAARRSRRGLGRAAAHPLRRDDIATASSPRAVGRPTVARAVGAGQRPQPDRDRRAVPPRDRRRREPHRLRRRARPQARRCSTSRARPRGARMSYTLLGRDGRPYASEGQGGARRRRAARRVYGTMDCPVCAVAACGRGFEPKHRVFFLDEETAIAAGFRPCGACLRERSVENGNCALREGSGCRGAPVGGEEPFRIPGVRDFPQ